MLKAEIAWSFFTYIPKYYRGNTSGMMDVSIGISNKLGINLLHLGRYGN
jgi:hypothetical protein